MTTHIQNRLSALEGIADPLPLFYATIDGNDIVLKGDGKKLRFRNESELDRWASENLTDNGKIRLVKYRIMHHD